MTTRSKRKAPQGNRPATSDGEMMQLALQEVCEVKEAPLRQDQKIRKERRRNENLEQRLRRMENGDAANISLVSPHGMDSRRMISSIDNVTLVTGTNKPNMATALGYRVTTDIYDGLWSLREYFTQFLFIARTNFWSEAAKVVTLASSLRGKARSVLDSLRDLENVSFEELKAALELRFGERLHTQRSYTEFSNRKQKIGEHLGTLADDLDRLVRLAYPEGTVQWGLSLMQ
ncbi:hypothetical protein KPH14_008501 [Odynerus spinipes]|uniref:Retrotransposon gag domain-containing protein n=1 Tax=Odynerus spinipes TaxID=1348599 RepID=A0AAD9RG18_9HYME|nr:hypothetical protein KPH14_008501 [Odynerus spinipes]